MSEPEECKKFQENEHEPATTERKQKWRRNKSLPMFENEIFQRFLRFLIKFSRGLATRWWEWNSTLGKHYYCTEKGMKEIRWFELRHHTTLGSCVNKSNLLISLTRKKKRPQQEVKCTQCETRLTFDTDQQLRPLFHGIDSLHAQQRMRHLLTRALVAYRTFMYRNLWIPNIHTKNHWPIFLLLSRIRVIHRSCLTLLHTSWLLKLHQLRLPHPPA